MLAVPLLLAGFSGLSGIAGSLTPGTTTGPARLGRLAEAGGPDGLELLVERRCVACHAPPPELAERLPILPASTLDGVGARVRPPWLADYLVPGGGHAPELGLAAAEHRALVDHLAARGAPFVDAAPAPDPGQLERGRQLYHAVGCVACHAPFDVPADLERPLWTFAGGGAGELDLPGGIPLDHLPAKTGHAALAAFLRDPLAVRPGGEMPSLRLSAGEADAIAAYLLTPERRADGPGFDVAPGLIAAYYEADDPSDVGDIEPVRTSLALALSGRDALPPHRDDGFAFRFTGFVDVPATGAWRLTCASDDGSRLWIDGELVVDHWGDHALERKSGERWLTAGRHTVEVTFYEHAGGEDLVVSWSGPGVAETPIPASALGHWKRAAAPADDAAPGSDATPAGAAAPGHRDARDGKPEEEAAHGSDVPPAGEAERAAVAENGAPGEGGAGSKHEPAAGRGGDALIARMRCGACHELPGGLPPPPAPPPAAPPLAALRPERASGCLVGAGAEPRPPGSPRFELTDAERAALTAALARVRAHAAGFAADPEGGVDAVDDPLGAGRLERTLARLDCRACHARDGAGGPDEERGRYFTVAGDLDLGDEGRLPPSLDRVGWKLRLDALAGVLLRGEGVRPYMRTRMPDFGAANVAHLPALLTALDARAPLAQPAPPAFDARDPAFDARDPAFDARDVELGRQLAGRASLGCVQCHDVAGNAGLGIPAADLARVHERVRYGWFRELLLAPDAVGMTARMPWFFADGTSPAVDVYGGDPGRQVDALWTWLSLGAALPLPDGVKVDADEHELVPTERVITCGVFFAGASARCVVVGFPERVHVAFDVGSSALIAAWKGRFFNAQGTWHGRAGKLEEPMGADAIRFARGVPFADVRGGEPWPTRPADELGYRVLGRRVAPDGRPTFRYAFAAGGGEVAVAEEIAPLVDAGAAGLRRTFTLASDRPFAVHLRAASGEERVERIAADECLVDRRLRVRAQGIAISGSADTEARVHVAALERDPTAPADAPYRAHLEVELRW